MLLVSTAQQNDSPCIYTQTSPSPFGRSFHSGQHSALRRVPCASQYVPLVAYFVHSICSVCVLISVSRFSHQPFPLLACLVTQSCPTPFETRSAGRLWNLEEARKEFFLNSQEKCSQVSTLLLVQWDPFSTSDPENYKTINLCCFGLPNLR